MRKCNPPQPARTGHPRMPFSYLAFLLSHHFCSSPCHWVTLGLFLFFLANQLPSSLLLQNPLRMKSGFCTFSPLALFLYLCRHLSLSLCLAVFLLCVHESVCACSCECVYMPMWVHLHICLNAYQPWCCSSRSIPFDFLETGTLTGLELTG